MPQLDLIYIELNWTRQIIKHIDTALSSKTMTDLEKITAIKWLIRQTQSVNRDE
jgi:hypothetical protein